MVILKSEMGKIRVAIYGAGVGGLSAAHELAKHPDAFDVHVYEASDTVGGKAASQFLTNTGAGHRKDLPGEHGFRFFPAFYDHLDKTMSEIPTSDGRSVLENLIGSESFAVVNSGRRPTVAKRRIGTGVESISGVVDALSTWFTQDALNLSAPDFGNLAFSMTKFMMSSKIRRVRQYDKMSWYDFTQTDGKAYSENYRSIVSNAPRMMVAMDGRKGSAYTIGKVGSQLFFLEPMRKPKVLDRVLNAPTSESWLDPWFHHLRARGIQFHFESGVNKFDLKGERGGFEIDCAHLEDGCRVEADYHICSIPVERLVPLIDDDMASACPQLSNVRNHLGTCTDWMVGAQYFLKRDVRLCAGHVLYIDSPWALTSISQRQFWERAGSSLADRYGRGDLGGIVSVDISNWDAIAPRFGRTAKQCTREEILDETFLQIMDGMNYKGEIVLRHEDVLARHLDSNIEFDQTTGRVSKNRTPLFIHKPGTFRYRPSVRSNITNLFLASDFVATDTNLASMEGANEAARRAVRSLIYLVGLDIRKPYLRPMPEPAALLPFQRMDGWLMQQGADSVDAFGADESELVELIRDVHLAKVISISELRRSLGGRSTCPPPQHLARSTNRLRSVLDRVNASLAGAERLLGKSTFAGDFGRSSSRPIARRAASKTNHPADRPSKLPSQIPPAA